MLEHEYVVVGAGSAGCALANRLTEDPRTRVLLLEAGKQDRAKEIKIPAAFSKLFKSRYDWGYSTTPQDGLGGRRIYYPRGKVLGGSSAMNAMMWIPGHRDDFAEWPEGWDWTALEPHLQQLEDGACAITPLGDPNPMSLAFVDATVRTTGAKLSDLRPESLDGVGIVRVTQRRGLRCSAADNYLKPVRRRPNLQVLTDAYVVRIEFDDDRAVAVTYERAGRQSQASVAREVILCAGAIGSPHLLMLSGVGPAEHLREHGVTIVSDLPEVGRGLQDHCMSIALFDAAGNDSLYAAESPRQLMRLVLRRRGMLTSNVGEAAAFVRTRPTLTAPDLELLFAPVLYMEEGLVPPPAHGFSVASVALQPASRGSVTLRSADPREHPNIDPGFLREPEDLRVLVDGVKLARTVANAEPLAGWFASERAPAEAIRTDAEITDWIRATAHTIYHPVGTCAIGRVIDGELRVNGVKGLRVADASVIPQIVRGHTHAATTMVAERAAALISSESAVVVQ
jgi:choline dehydrogenase